MTAQGWDGPPPATKCSRCNGLGYTLDKFREEPCPKCRPAKVVFLACPEHMEVRSTMLHPGHECPLQLRGIVVIHGKPSPIHEAQLGVNLCDPILANLLFQAKRLKITIEVVDE